MQEAINAVKGGMPIAKRKSKRIMNWRKKKEIKKRE